MKSLSLCLLLFVSQLDGSGTYFDITASVSNDTLLVITDSDYDIYGYQFQITNLSLIDCSSPDDIPLAVSENDGEFLGFSLLGEFIPSGERTLLSCIITDNQVTNIQGACIDTDSIVISLESSGGYAPAIPSSEIEVGDCLYLDCSNIIGGTSFYDSCISIDNPNGVCGGDNTSCTDCNGIVNGTAELDGCEICVGGDTGLLPCANDCSGNTGGLAVYNECNTCICNGEIAAEGYTCIESDSDCIQGCDDNWTNDGTHLIADECGVCGGVNVSCSDCAGIPNGTSQIDCLGNCGDPDSDTFAKEDLCGNCAGSCNSIPEIDCECSLVTYSGIETITCTGDCNPLSYTDPCFVWNDETWVNDTTEVGNTEYWDEGEEINDINGNGMLDIGCYDCGGNYINDENFDYGNIFKEYSCAISGLVYSTDYYCSALINNNLIEEGQCLNTIEESLVDEFTLFNSYPNPFNPITTITYSVKNPGKVNIDIYNVLGQHVYSLIDGYHFPGKTYEVIWNSDNQSKLPISSGVYLLKAKSAENILIQQITLNK